MKSFGPLRLISDDLTGALDSSAGFLPMVGGVSVNWRAAGVSSRLENIAFCTGTREVSARAAQEIVTRVASGLGQGGIAYKKLDSLLRGHPAHEIGAWWHAGEFQNLIVAPAFPAQCRWMEGGVQHYFGPEGTAEIVGPNLRLALARLNLPVRIVTSASDLRPGLSLCDAAQDSDLDDIVTAGMALAGRTLWCGTAGLAHAFGRLGGEIDFVDKPSGLFGIVGTLHPVTRAQIDQLERSAPEMVIRVRDANLLVLDEMANRANSRIKRSESTLVAFDIAQDATSSTLVDQAISNFVDRIDRPSALFITGGETCMNVCLQLNARELLLDGQWGMGIPVSTMCGGRWDGMKLISKSGAFGSRSILAELFGREV